MINIPVHFGGLNEATQGLRGIGEALGQAADAAVGFQRGQHAAGAAIGDMAGKVSAAGSAIANFGRIAGVEAVSQLGNFVAATGQSAAAGAQLGAMFGPQGAIVGGITGALMPALADLIERFDEAEDAERRLAERMRGDIRTLDEYERSIRELNAALHQRAVLDAGLGSADQHTARAQQYEAQARAHEAEIAAVRRQLHQAREAHSFWNDTTREINQLTERLRELEGMRDTARSLAGSDRSAAARAREELDSITIEDTETAAEEEGRRTREEQQRERERAAREHAEILASNLESFHARMEAAEEAMTSFLQEENQRRLDYTIALYEKEREAREQALREQRELEEAEARVKREREAREAEQRREEQRRAREEAARADRVEQERIQKRTDDWNTLFEIGTEVTTTLSDAVADVVLGNKSAEEAFDGLLKAFLEMISEYCSLMAAKEFAEAAAKFGQQDYAGGAMHIAAGVGFTAVAIATGIGAAAINSPPSESKPSEPQSTNAGSQQGGDVVIHWNSPIVTAQTRAQLGREIRGMVRAAETRGL